MPTMLEGEFPNDAAASADRGPSDVLVHAREIRRSALAHRRTLSGSGDEQLLGALDDVRGRIASGDPPGDVLVHYRQLLAERDAIDAHDRVVRTTVATGIEGALDDLAADVTPWVLIQRAAGAVCGAAGFTRSMVSAVRGTRWVPLVVHTRDDLDPKAETFRAFVSEHMEIPLANMLGETEIARRRTPIRFSDPVNDRRTFKTIILAAGTPGYVAGPIVSGTRTLGFLHVDRVGQGHPMTEDDRVALGAFVDGLGWLLDRAEARRAFDRRADEIDAAVDRSLAAFRQVRASSPLPIPDEIPGAEAGAVADRPAPRDAVLTPREREVLELVADGATNWAIAQRLTLSEDTVKTHLRSIRRKLRVKSRSAAVARYRRIAEVD
jgi:LuxR family transcriptional regulator, regulator of acetate metabolism